MYSKQALSVMWDALASDLRTHLEWVERGEPVSQETINVLRLKLAEISDSVRDLKDA